MSNSPKHFIDQRKSKITILFWLLVIGMGIFLLSVIQTISNERRIPSHNTTLHDRSFRGAIISADNYTLANSQKTYQAVIKGASIKPEKREVFIKLFSIYANIPEKKIRASLTYKSGEYIQRNITLSDSINSSTAMQLKSLALKLRRLGVFRSTKNRAGINVLFGLDIIENGESRRFPLKDVMSPILGYIGKKQEGRYVRPEGQKGLEKNYNEHITSKKDGYFKGKRDVLGAVIHDKNSIDSERVDGLDLHLNIPLALQRRVELMIDAMKEKLDAQEILVGVMESQTGKVLSLASTERFDPAHILQKDIPALNPKFSEYPHEAGSVVKPITLAIALENNLITPQTWFNTYNGRMKIGKRRTITDDHKFESLNATDIIVHSSNVGISQISWKLSGDAFRKGLINFGMAKPSGLDLSRDLPGSLKKVYLLNHKLHRANSSYGYGMTATFSQLLKAYSAFNNEGMAMTPRIVSYLGDKDGNQYTLEPKVGDIKAVSKKTANQVKTILQDVVKRGTGVKAQYSGLEIGGKTGTAHIAKNGRYVREYHSSFYGFANDKQGKKYTIGVLVIRAKKRYKYFASLSAVPTFKNIVSILVNQGHLTPDANETTEKGIDASFFGVEEKPTPTPTPSTNALQPKKEQDASQSPATEKPSVKKLFNIKKPQPAQKPQPIKKKPLKVKVKPKPKPSPKVIQSNTKEAHELFEDLF
ncbi:MAG: Cell division protein FtsI [Peptidoglycan synthetase] (EC [uncultured Sulfurovum sp.]|uniref:Cell division protein FtsI [Peptidoglycan synthetase] (EC) n=1 Tax=uncultured Sulfurovum sp. TaxID=269237 RepID=A0A6S6TD33_9BACT|nr:MAG: Cell division protein FtsI [Peptidoglycan synthetase] (EC [uncultured Sulfurovum sp.]